MLCQLRRQLFCERSKLIIAEQPELIRIDILAAGPIMLPQELGNALAQLLNRLLIRAVRLRELRNGRLLLPDDRLERGDVVR